MNWSLWCLLTKMTNIANFSFLPIIIWWKDLKWKMKYIAKDQSITKSPQMRITCSFPWDVNENREWRDISKCFHSLWDVTGLLMRYNLKREKNSRWIQAGFKVTEPTFQQFSQNLAQDWQKIENKLKLEVQGFFWLRLWYGGIVGLTCWPNESKIHDFWRRQNLFVHFSFVLSGKGGKTRDASFCKLADQHFSGQ